MKEFRNQFPKNSIRICIHEEMVEIGEVKGIICATTLEKDIVFKSKKDLILKIDEVFDNIGQPQPNQVARSFQKKQNIGYNHYCENPPIHRPSEQIRCCSGKIRTVDLIMLSRSKSEWQGTVVNVNSGTSTSFQSTIECVKLL